MEGACLIWVDAGGANIGERSWPKPAPIRVRRTATGALCATTLGTRKWPSRHTTVFLHGGRDEVAAGVMVFDPQWYREVFFLSYKAELRKLMAQGMITTDQGMLTLLVQVLPITLLVPSYAKMAERLLLQGGTPCVAPRCHAGVAKEDNPSENTRVTMVTTVVYTEERWNSNSEQHKKEKEGGWIHHFAAKPVNIYINNVDGSMKFPFLNKKRAEIVTV